MDQRRCWMRCLPLVLAAVISWQPQVAGATTADDLCLPTADPCVVSTSVQVTPGSVIDVGERVLRIAAGGTLLLASGMMTLLAGEFELLDGGALSASGSGSVPGANIEVNAGTIWLRGTIDTSGRIPGRVTLDSEGMLDMGGLVNADSKSSDEDGGTVLLSGGTVQITNEVSAVGGLRAFGGSVSITATGDVTIAAVVDAAGGEGGTLLVTAGSGIDGAGNLFINDTGSLLAGAQCAGCFGGDIDLVAEGDAETTGHVTLRGVLEADGSSGSEDEGGGDGGIITVTADGDILNDRGTGTFDASGGGPDGEGGEIALLSITGDILLYGRVRVRSLGYETAGGEVSLEAEDQVTVYGELDASGGGFDGGVVSVTTQLGDIQLIGSGVGVNVSSTDGGGFGGEIELSAGMVQPIVASDIVVNMPLIADGSRGEGFGGDGGVIFVVAGGDVQMGASLKGDGAGGGGWGGDVVIQAKTGGVTLGGQVGLKGDGAGGRGGRMSITAADTVATAQKIEVRGQNGASAGQFHIRAGGQVDLTGDLLVTGTGSGDGGVVNVISDSHVVVNDTVDAGAGAQAAVGGVITIAGCNVDVMGGGGELLTSGPQSTNLIEARGPVRIDGRMIADTTTGGNVLRLRPQGVYQVSGTVKPSEQVVRDSVLVPCGQVTATRTLRESATPTPTRTPHVVDTPTIGSPTVTPTVTRTPTRTDTPTPTLSPPPISCVGDCNQDDRVTIDELIRGVNIALGAAPVEDCLPFDDSGDGKVTIDELIRAVNAALTGCPK